MLVFQLNAGHILDDGCKRAGIDPKWLLESVADINQYLPDDWRLTRSVNNFRIQIIASRSATLIGSCYRTDHGKILHVVDSLHLTKFHDCVDLRQRPERIIGPIRSGRKRQHPELIIPNLYYFRPCPEGFETPLFARQYERIKYKSFPDEKAGDEYHRIHPLTKAGLDLEHFMWVRWTINGDINIVASPDPDYHGKDYWLVPKLVDDFNRAEYNTYFRIYEKILNHYGVATPAPPEKPDMPYETEFKYLVRNNPEEASTAFDLICETLGRDKNPTGFSISEQDSRHKTQVDIYFDDENLSLYKAGASFRIRKKETLKITLKKRFPRPEPEKNLYRRIEEEAVITAAQEEALMLGKPINAFPYRLIPYIAPECKVIKPLVFVKNQRRILYIRDNGYRKAEVCFDRVQYQIEGKTVGPFYEIEIESKGAKRTDIEQLAKYLEKNLGLMPSAHSKYERGILLLKDLRT